MMGAIAVSKKEEQQIERLRKELRIPTKAGVLRAALKILEHQTAEERLRHEVHDSVRRCAAADKREHRELSRDAVGRWTSEA
jgi:pyrroline-5-carboxylate reductase